MENEEKEVFTTEDIKEQSYEEIIKDVIEEMNNFAIRVLKGQEDVRPQETAILPEILKILESLPDRESDRDGD